MKKFIIALVVITTLPILATAQQSRIDSLNASQPDTTSWGIPVYSTRDCECFTEEQIDGIYKGIRRLERSDSLKTLKIEAQDQQIQQLNVQINNYKELAELKTDFNELLKQRIDLKDEQINLLEKKIRRNRIKNILRGTAAGIVIGLVINI